MGQDGLVDLDRLGAVAADLLRSLRFVPNPGDVLAVLFYAFTEPTGACGDNPNANGVDYDCVKGVDLDGDAMKTARGLGISFGD